MSELTLPLQHSHSTSTRPQRKHFKDLAGSSVLPSKSDFSPLLSLSLSLSFKTVFLSCLFCFSQKPKQVIKWAWT